jgi:hypothetical protein
MQKARRFKHKGVLFVFKPFDFGLPKLGGLSPIPCEWENKQAKKKTCRRGNRESN